MKINKIFSLLMVFACCMLTACSSVNMGTVIYTDGSIAQTYEINLDKDELQKIGIDTVALLNKIEELTEEQWENASNGKDLTNITFDVQKTTYSRVIVIKFGSFDDYARFYEIDTSTPTEQEIRKTLFYNKKMIRNSASNYNTISTTNVYNQIYNFLLTNYFENSEQMMQYAKNITTLTSLIYPSSLKTKSNATLKQKTGNYDIHIWQSNLEKEMSESPQKIEVWQTYYTIENRIAWYGTGVVITIVFGIVLFVILFIKNKKKAKIEDNNAQTTITPESIILPQIIQDIYNGKVPEYTEEEKDEKKD